MLMQDDYIQLEFSLSEAAYIGIGDYIVDPIFGTFYITAEQSPRYNARTGGYDYSLRFDADYMRWRNHLLCLVAGSARMETSWRLTDRLASHAQAVIDNVHLIFPPTVNDRTDTSTGVTIQVSTGYGLSIEGVEAATEAHYIAYDGTDIISALNAIAESFGCEWWVTGDKITIGNVEYAHTLHFGKCEDSGSAYELSLADNVESMDISRDQQTYANRIYIYGGTQNIPGDYDHTLIFTVTDYTSADGFEDSGRPLSLDMIGSEAIETSVTLTMGNTLVRNGNTYTQSTNSVALSGAQTVKATIFAQLRMDSSERFNGSTDHATPSVSATIRIRNGNEVTDITTINDIVGIDGEETSSTIAKIWNIRSSFEQLVNDASQVSVEIVWSITFNQPNNVHMADTVSATNTSAIKAVADASAATKELTVIYNGSNYPAVFYGATGKIKFTGSTPARWRRGATYRLSPMTIKVPLSYYTPDYSVSGIRSVGERRLHLPGTVRYVENAVSNASQRVEIAVVFDQIFPKLSLRIKEGSLGQRRMQQKVEHDDGSVTWENWVQYSFEIERTDGTAFDFSLDYLMDGQKLQAVFTAPQTMSANGFLLAGMTFDLGFANGRYTIIRNEDYGASLPNEILKPSEGDTLFLTGWNPKAISSLGLVSDAENELESKGNEYLQALTEGQFTINAKMMSRTMQYYPFCNGNDTSGRRMYGLLEAGCKVTVTHAALPGGSKTSRVLGYEYKLDIPYDTPTYIIGETEAFSRLKQIEKQLQKL